MMVGQNTSFHETQFTVSVDAILPGVTTGISAGDRALTIRALVDETTNPEELGRPGHVFPLKAKNRGVLRRAGHTEAAVDLNRLAGLYPSGVLVEVMNDDGTMARLPQLMEFATRFNLKIITIKDLIAYRLQNESLISRGEEVELPTRFGRFRIIPYQQKSNGMEHIALIKGSWVPDEPIPVRVHSSCMTGDIFGSLRCECGDQLHQAMEIIENRKGVIVYIMQEGRGIGLLNKIAAYKLRTKDMIPSMPISTWDLNPMNGITGRSRFSEPESNPDDPDDKQSRQTGGTRSLWVESGKVIPSKWNPTSLTNVTLKQNATGSVIPCNGSGMTKKSCNN